MSKSVLEYLVEMVQIDSESLDERAMADYLIKELQQLGGEVREDKANEKTGGNAGNVIAWFDGKEGIEPLMLNAHMDTVTPGNGVVPDIRGGIMYSAGGTVLGADDKSGIAMILAVIAQRKKEGNLQVPLEVVFTISEEIGLLGAKELDCSLLRSKRGYSLDGNKMGELVKASPSQINYKVTFQGKSVHAGVEPEKGLNAIVIAADYLRKLPDGRIDEVTTMNIGKIKGGKATNIVCDEVMIEGEIRSHKENKLQSLLELVQKEAESVKEKWKTGVKFEWHTSFKGLQFEETEDLIEISHEAFSSLGINQGLVINGGGSDANALAEHGIRLAVVGTGMQKIHTIEEFIDLEDLETGYQWLDNILSIWEERCGS
ncbi:MAG: M20/M25/M40 family metallo-hydrolase [Candidatus Cloacimonetes bacterium]|nr:M20/M25/M40 family metallo-hydrolase [Candidatus Cloacimonadota bacterium]